MKELSLLQQARYERTRRKLDELNRISNVNKKIDRIGIIKKLLPNYVIQAKPEAFHKSTKPDKWIIGGYGSGKTYTFGANAIMLAYVNRPYPGLLVSQIKANGTKTTFATLEKLFNENDIQFTTSEVEGYTDVKIDFGNGDYGNLWIASGYNANSLKGPTVAFAGIDEPFIQDEETFNVVVGRIREPNAVINEFFASGTIEPLEMEWGFDIVDNDFKGDEHTFKTVIATTENKFAPKSYIARMRRNYSEELQAVYIDGRNVDFNGKNVYSGYNSEINKKPIESLVLPKNQFIQLGLGFDFNVDPMCACEFILRGIRREQVEEHIISGSNTEELCDLIISRMIEKYPGIEKKKRQNYSVIISMDANAKSRKTSAKIGVTDAITIRDKFRESGIRYKIVINKVNPPVRDRVSEVNKLLREGNYIIYDNCVQTIKDRKFVKYKKGAEGFVINKSNGKLTHLSDAGDYWLWDSQNLVKSLEREKEGKSAIRTGGHSRYGGFSRRQRVR